MIKIDPHNALYNITVCKDVSMMLKRLLIVCDCNLVISTLLP
jgi:hypothetical protein